MEESLIYLKGAILNDINGIMERTKMGTKKKLTLLASALIVVSLAAYLLVLWISQEQEVEMIGIPTLHADEIRNPDIALKYGIKGYLEIKQAPDASKSLTVEKEGQASTTILLHFVSYTADLTEILVNIDPNSGEGLSIERGTVTVNKLVSYVPSGIVTVKAGQTLPVKLTIRVPKDFPNDAFSFPIGAVGITADIPIIDEIDVMIYAS